MATPTHDAPFSIICAIANFGMGSRILRFAKRHGIRGGTIGLAKGTAHSRLLEILDLCDVRKEIVYMVADTPTARAALDTLDREFHFVRPHHGIAFVKPIACFMGAGHYIYCDTTESEEEQAMGYHSITVIVDKGRAELAMEAASEAGAKGGTIMNARGSGVHEMSSLFSMEIEPEKEILLILCKPEASPAILDSIRIKLEMDKPGNGVMFVEHVERAIGLHS